MRPTLDSFREEVKAALLAMHTAQYRKDDELYVLRGWLSRLSPVETAALVSDYRQRTYSPPKEGVASKKIPEYDGDQEQEGFE